MCDSSLVDTPQDFRELCSGRVTEQQVASIFNKFIPNDLWVYGVNPPPDENSWDMQNVLYNYCNSDLGYLCQTSLQDRCAGYTYEDMQNTTIRNFCGCQLKQDQYLGDIARECHDICSNPNVISYWSSPSSAPAKCEQATCVIDNITVNLAGGTTGNVSFNQVCPTCSLGNCRCVINKLNVISSDLQRMNVGQNCSNDSKCYIDLENGERSEVACSSMQLGMTTEQVHIQKTRNYLLLYVLALAVIVITLILSIR